MELSKSNRIFILLAIDTAFFLLELSVGYAVHSLALVADSFHMLNDVLSLCVGLWAVKVAQQKKKSNMYTYGWQRAETLGALINGVFLVALCLSIFLDVIQRLVEPQEVSHPKLVLIVGSLGLASNIIGLFLFHEHGHSHGGGSHGEHSHGQPRSKANGLRSSEEGVNGISDGSTAVDTAEVANENGNVADVLPESRISNWSSTPAQHIRFNDSNQTRVQKESTDELSTGRHEARRRHSRSRSRAYSRPEEISIHPASFRNEIIAASRFGDPESGTDSEAEQAVMDEETLPSEQTPLLDPTKSSKLPSTSHRRQSSMSARAHKDHRHNQAKEPGKKGSHGHSHGDLNMRGVFLHVMGDALGNIGVIASALVIWLTDFKWRFYADPLISFVITIIILCSAIPLCKAASRILLQAVPAGLSVDDIRNDIRELPGIISCHHLHVWQLSDTKLVASLHVQVDFDFKGEGSARYMDLARAIRTCLHEYGIHSSTIQPEFCLDASHAHGTLDDDSESSCGAEYLESRMGADNGKKGSRHTSKSGSLRDEPTCLLECGDECGDSKLCCAPDSEDAAGTSSSAGRT